eukprot:6461057-Amphidinium_carterae.1
MMRCYKVMLCDPKDLTIPDLSSLRTAVAQKAPTPRGAPCQATLTNCTQLEVTYMPLANPGPVHPINRLFSSIAHHSGCLSMWQHCSLQTTTTARTIELPAQSQLPENRHARTPAIGNPSSDGDMRVEAGEEDEESNASTQLLAPTKNNSLFLEAGAGDVTHVTTTPSRQHKSSNQCHQARASAHVNQFKVTLNAQLPNHCRACFGKEDSGVTHTHTQAVKRSVTLYGEPPVTFSCKLRSGLNASGMTLDDALARGQDDQRYALRCFLGNLQVWGSLGSVSCPAVDQERATYG